VKGNVERVKQLHKSNRERMNSIAHHTLVYRQQAASPTTPPSLSLYTHASAVGHHPSRRRDVTHLCHMYSSRNLGNAAFNTAVTHQPVAAETAPAVFLKGTGQAPAPVRKGRREKEA